MNNPLNIISTPDITGNIGSCTSNAVSVHSGRTFTKEYFTNIVTNSCTGEIKVYENWDYAMPIYWGMFIVVVVFLASVITWLKVRGNWRFELPKDQ